MIRVLTLNQSDLQKAASRLVDLATEDGFAPDLVVSIANGGTRVVQSVEADLVARGIHVAALRCQRPGTKSKTDLGFRRWLPALPLVLRDGLRIFEHYIRILRDRIGPETTRSVIPLGQSSAGLKPARRILVIDDAVDSGATLAAVESYLKGLQPEAAIRFAALAQTRRTLARTPDYSLHSGILIRFPWSMDYKPPTEKP